MKTLIKSIKRLALALCLATPFVSWAEAITAVNPVTGEAETYTYKYVGTTGTWTAEDWQNSEDVAPSAVPQASGSDTWDSLLIDGDVDVTAGYIEGWDFRIGLFGGANLDVTKIRYWNGTAYAVVDADSKLTIKEIDTTVNWNATVDYYVAASGGVTYECAFSPTATANAIYNYRLTGSGSVAYEAGVTAGAHVIKSADVTLSGGEKAVVETPKKLVSFGGSATATFTADATIAVKNALGEKVAEKAVANIANGETTLTADSDVGACELVKKDDGIYLYWVDGDPAAIVEKTYKPSININFTSGTANGLTTSADVGLTGYEVPGTSWNNFTIPNNGDTQTFSTVNSTDSTGAASVEPGVTVTVSNHRGRYSCSGLDAASNPLHGYIDEGGETGSATATPTVTITGIPYDHYRVIVYHSTDSANLPFGYDTINGFNFTYVNGEQTIGTTSWGSSGAADSANAIEEGVNTLVSAVLSGDTVTMVAHRTGTATSASVRGCFAAIQVVEYVPEVGENDLEIAVDGDKEYEVTKAKELSGTVYLTGSGTLTLSGDYKITAATIDVAKDVVLNVNADRLDATTFTGAGTVVYDGVAPVAEKGWTAIGWSGTVWLKNQAVSQFESNQYGNGGSTVRFTGVTGFLQSNTYDNRGYVHAVPLELVDDGNTVAFTYNNGWSGFLVKINTLKGTGTLSAGGSGSGEHVYIVDGSGFTGVFNLTGKYVYVGGAQPEDTPTTNPNGKLEIRSGETMTVPSGKTWTANGGFVVDGTLNATGTLASSHASKAVSGSGTVVFGGVPSPVDDAWWKNSAWTGTVQVNGYTSMAGNIPFNSCGNAGSIVELKNVTGWINNNFTCAPKLKITGTLTLNNGSSNKGNAFKVGTLLGDGCIYGDSSAPTVVFNVTTDWSGFTGTIALNNKCVVFGETIPDALTQGTIYVSSGAVVTPQQASGTWWAVGGIKVDGELRAPNLDKFGGGTTITTTDTGVFTLTDSNNTDDKAVDYARITGTGTLRYADVSGKWRTLSAVNFPTGMICENNLSAGLILTTQGENTVGSLAGSGSMRSDWGGSKNVGDRTLKILQAKNTTYSGVFHSDDRITTVTVATGTSTAGTLTLSGTQTVSNDLSVESGASVKLTGTWKGATTVAGTIGGTGTIDGALTFGAGATFKVYATDDEDGLVATSVAYPEEGTVTVDVSAIEPEADVALLKATGLNATKFTLMGEPKGASLEVVEDVLTLKLAPATVDITVPDVTGATVAVTADGQPVEGVAGVYTVNIGAAVVVTYTVDGAVYQVTGSTQISFEATAETTSVTAPTTKAYTAWLYNADDELVLSSTDNAIMVAGTFWNTSTYKSVRFAEYNETVYSILSGGCSYDELTKTYTRLPTVAYIDSTPFTSLSQAVAEAADKTVTLAMDVTLDTRVEPNPGEGATMTIDLGGFTITREGTSGNGSVFDVKSGTVTIKNGTIDCTQDDTAIVADGVYAITARGTATLTLEDLVVTVDSQAGACAYPLQSSTIVIKSGTYKNVTETEYQYHAGWTGMAVNQPNVETQQLFVEGGTYSKVNPELGDDSGLMTDFCKAGYISVDNGDGTYTVKSGAWRAEAAGVKYETLADAVANVPAEGTVTLLTDVTLTARVEPAKSMTIDLNGKTITREGTGGNGSAFDVKSGTVTIKNGTIDCTQDDTAIVADGVYAITARGTATLTLEDLVVTVDSQAGACAYPLQSSTIVIKSGTYKNVTETEYQYHAGWTGMAVNQPNVETQQLFVEGGTYSKVDPKLGDDSGKMTNFCKAGYTTVADSGAWKVVRAIPAGTEDTTTYETADAAQAVVAEVAPSVPAAVAEELTTTEAQAAYTALFEAKVVPVAGETTTYKVVVDLKPTVVEDIQETVDAEESDIAAAAAVAAANAQTGGTATVTATPGLYYIVEAGTSPTNVKAVSCTLATAGEIPLNIPNQGESGFYKVRVSVTPVEIQQ